MSLKVQQDHQIVQLSKDFKLAYRKVNYLNFDALERRIRNSNFTFDHYYESMTSLNRKFEWLSIRQLLIELGDEIDIKYDEHGKPHFVQGKAHLSISHSRESIAVSMHASKPHGIDLQYLTSKIKRIKHKYLRDEELVNIDLESTEELSIYWSMKEALFKLYGKKDIFLKENIRISNLIKKDHTYLAKGEIIGVPQEISVNMEGIVLKDYVLAYTLIP